MIAPALSLLRRLMGSCPLWHRSPNRLTHSADQRLWYTCVLCERVTSEALIDQPRAQPLDGPVITSRPLTVFEELQSKKAKSA